MNFSSENHPLNLNSPNFDSEAYVNNLIQRKSLDELVAVEEDMVQNVRRLDSEMQQLVYENYNKFLTATSTVRNMQTAFMEMDNEIHGLANRMKSISTLSDALSQKFGNNRETIRKLVEHNKTIHRLQYFVKLPQILQELIDQGKLKKAAEIYVGVWPKLDKYKSAKSMAGIYAESKALMDTLEQRLRDTFVSKTFCVDDVLEAAGVLRALGAVEGHELRDTLLAHWRQQIDVELEKLAALVSDAFATSTIGASADTDTDGDNAKIPSDGHANDTPALRPHHVDVLDFVDGGCCTFLTNLSLYISVYVQLFLGPEDRAALMSLVDASMHSLEQLLARRFAAERNPRDCALFVKALDRISRKIAVFSRVLLGMDYSRMNSDVIRGAAEHQTQSCRENIRLKIRESLRDLFVSFIAISSPINNASSTTKGEGEAPSASAAKIGRRMVDTVTRLEQTFLVAVKTALANLLLFIANDMNFVNIDPTYFGTAGTFSVQVFEKIVAGSLVDLCEMARDVREILIHDDFASDDSRANATLAFCALCHALRTRHVSYLVDLSQEQFKLMELKTVNKSANLATSDELSKQLKVAISELLRNFVEFESNSLDLLTTKAFEQFDWAQISEAPRTIRPQTRQVLRRIEDVNTKIAHLTGERTVDAIGDALIDSTTTSADQNSAMMTPMRRATSAASSTLTNTIETNSLGGSSVGANGALSIMEKLWSDEPDGGEPLSLLLDRAGVVDSIDDDALSANSSLAPTIAQLAVAVASTLDFRRRPIIGAVIRICLRRIADSLTRCKFCAFGLQKLQLECAYLKHHLVDIIADEYALNTLIDDCMSVAVSRCDEPRLLEPKLVRTIIECGGLS